MSFSHREETRHDRQLDVLIDKENGLRVIVSRLGAELISLARINETGDWVGFLYRDNDISAPARGWANHATVMGYYLHRLKEGRSIYRGQEITGGTHGFLRHKTWHFASAENGSLTYRITPDDFSATDYPLNVSLDLTYQIDMNKVTVAFACRNDEPKLTAHVGFGLHPGFAATSFDSFRLQMPRGLYRRHFSLGNYLSGETRDLEFRGGEMPFPRDELSGSFILELVDIPRREFSYVDPPSGRWVIVDLVEVPYLTLWSDGGLFLCVEPCWGLTDHHQQRAFEDKEGMQRITAGGTLRASFSMAPQFASSD
jgi:galactose mutarotase-like enzyme